MNEKPRQTLCTIMRDYGREVAQDPKRCKGLLNDLCGEHKREINVLVSAMDERVASDLLNLPPNIPPQMRMPQLVKRLHDHTGIATEYAWWAVESWALALGVIQRCDLTEVRKEREKQEREERERQERQEREERERQERQERQERKRKEQREWWGRIRRERKKAWGFITRWTIAATGGFAALYVTIPPLNNVLNDILMNHALYDPVDYGLWTMSYETGVAAFSALFGAMLGTISGAFLGVVQGMTLHRYTPRTTWWILSTAVGFGGSFAILYPFNILGGIDYDGKFLFVPGAIFGLVLGIAQWLVLRRHTVRATWWILALTIGFGVICVFANGPFYDFVGYTVFLFVILGCMLEWLLRNPRKD
ncbi:MAG: hypothetical protein HC884_16385 [Chloroflexaceae bacterium]|nr:hypothetical protein [Chloroflexaceae bacterium]